MATTTWDGSSSTDWSVAANWDTNAVPIAGDYVIIPDDSTTANDCTLTASDNPMGNIYIMAGGSLTGAGKKITLNGSTGMNTMRWVGTITGLLDVDIIGGVDKVIKDDSGTGNIRDLTIDNAGNTFNIGSAASQPLTIDGNLTITAGTLDTTTDNNALTVAGNTYIATAGTLTLNSSTTTFTGGNDGNWAFSNAGTLNGGTGICNVVYGFSTYVNSVTVLPTTMNCTGVQFGYPFNADQGLGTGSWDSATNSSTVNINVGESCNIRMHATDSQPFYNLVINSPGYTVYTKGGRPIEVDNNFTITAGTYSTDNAGSAGTTAFTVTGDATVTGTMKGNASAIELGSLTIDGGGEYDATSATTTLTDENGSGFTIQLSSGTFTHNNGKVVINNGGGVNYGAIQCGTASSTVGIYDLDFLGTSTKAQFYGASDPAVWNDVVLNIPSGEILLRGNTGINGDFTITAGEFDGYNGVADTNNLTVEGNVSVTGTMKGNAGAMTFGSLTIQVGGTYTATSGVTEITSNNGGARAFKMSSDPPGTFTHNDGTVVISDPIAGSGNIGGNDSDTITFYNLIIEGDNKETRDLPILAVENDLTIDSGLTFGPEGADGVTNVTGTTLVSGTLDLNQGAGANHNFGVLTIEGVFRASAATTTITGNYTQSGTFTHNDGLIHFNASALNITGTAPIGPFYDLKSTGVNNEIRKNMTCENSFIIASGYVRPTTTNATWTMGTATNSAYISGTAASPILVHDAGTGAGNYFTVQAADVTQPVALKGYEWDWMQVAETPQNIKFGGVDCQFDINTGNGATEANTFTLIEQCSFAAFTVEATSTLDLNGNRAFFDGALTLNTSSNFDFGGGMVYVNDNFNNVGVITLTDAANGTLVQEFAGGCSMRHPTNIGTVFINAGTTSSNPGTAYSGMGKFIVGGTHTANDLDNSCTDVTIPDGGILTAGSSTITCSGDFNVGGGLIGKSALLFDGVNDYCNGPSLSAGTLNPTDNLYVEAWWKSTDGTPETTSIIGKASSYLLYINSSGHLQGYAYGSSSNIDATYSVSIFDQKWHHCAMGYSQAGGLKVWLDGKLVAADATDAGTLTQNANDIRVMRHSAAYGQGTVAMGRIWTGAVPTNEQLRSNMFKGEADSPAYTSGVLQTAWYFDEGTGTGTDAVEDVGVGTNCDLDVDGATWAGAGDFTGGTSTLEFNKAGTQYFNYLDSENIAGINVANGSTTILNDIVGNEHPIYISGNFTVSGTLDNTSGEYLRMNNNFTDNSSVIDIASGTVTGVASLVSDVGSGAVITLTEGTYPQYYGYSGITRLGADITMENGFTSSYNGNTGSPTIDLNGYTMTVKTKFDLRSNAIVTMGAGSVLHYITAGGNGIQSNNYSSGGQSPATLAVGPGATIKGLSSANKCSVESQNNWSVVGKCENLNITNEELKVTGQVINCTGDIIQQHPSIDADQQLDYDTADDRDIMLGRDLDKNTELVT